jgi:nucleotide-binding universal stress UspA family protein
MTYKTILVHADKSRRADELVRVAAGIARAAEAHLIGVATTGISRYALPVDATLHDPYMSQHIEFMRQRARQSLDKFETHASQLGLASVESRLTEDESGGGLALQARYADLVVIGQTDPEEPYSPAMTDLPQYLVLHSARPILIVPYIGQFSEMRDNVLVAWDASPSATRAVTDALPLLKRARRVDVVVFNPGKQSEAHGEQPGADIALYLARHGIKVNVIARTTRNEIGEALLSTAAELCSSLIVMGGYGHTRFHEILLGGATQTVLESMTVPTLMSH